MGLLNQSYHEDDPSYGYDARQSDEVLRALYEQEIRYKAESPAREAKEKAERERLAKVRREKVEDFLKKGGRAKKYPVKVGDMIEECSVISTEVENAEWALLGEQCFPLKFQGKNAPYILDKERRIINLEDLVHGQYGRKGYYYSNW